MKCPKCGKGSEKDWQYCPKCGFGLRRMNSDFSFNDIFERVQKQMESMDKSFTKDLEAFDLSPAFRQVRERPVGNKARGFRITMSSGTGKQPKISVKTFGDNNEEMKNEILGQIGAQKQERSENTNKVQGRRFRIPLIIRPGRERVMREERKEIPIQGNTEEPKTNVKRMGSGVVVDMDVPGVKSGDDVSIRELENSVEVKAIASDKSYFKILTKPSNFRLTEKRFKKGKLQLGFS